MSMAFSFSVRGWGFRIELALHRVKASILIEATR